MSKDKWVRRFSVDETSRHKSGFTIYKITSVLFPISSPEALSVVCVWKRYSDARRLHASLRSLHSGLQLRGVFPALPTTGYFKRFQQEVIEERAKAIKTMLEFIAQHQLLFTSTDFVHFLQSGFPPPAASPVGTIAAIRSSLQLPDEPAPPLEYRTEDEGSTAASQSADETDFSRIPIHSPVDVERRISPVVSESGSFESIQSLESIDSDLYSELEKVTVKKTGSLVKKNVLPDLIIFDAPSTSEFDDYHTMTNPETVSVTSDQSRSVSRVSTKSVPSLSNVSNIDCKTRTEDSYVFEAGYMFSLAARYEESKDYAKCFECYKAGIEKMLIGVQSDTDQQRRSLIKEKTNKYLAYAETIYNNHLCNVEHNVLLSDKPEIPRLHCPIPISMLRRPYEDLSLYRVLAVLGNSVMLVLHRYEQTCYAMKVIQKVPNNLTEFDEYFLQNTNETRQPILPTVIPYMVSLNSYIETNNLIFLILSYAPGEKLFEYIKNYAKSNPNTPAREVNLENVFTEPKIKNTDFENENLNVEIESSKSDVTIVDRDENSTNNNRLESDEVTELVLNSQKLLLNVDKALSGESVSVKVDPVKVEDVKVEAEGKSGGKSKTLVERRVDTPSFNRCPPRPCAALPPATASRWGAQILTALESLHNYGVICRDLNPSNILLGEAGQIILTYFISYAGLEMCLAKVHKGLNLYIAPELYSHTHIDDREDAMDRVCDFWSFGAIMYELLCGVPLTFYHRSVFTSHTILQLPDGLPIEVQSLLTQLLTYEPSERLGGGKDGIEEIKRHPYFKLIDWTEIYDKWSVPD